MFRDSKNVGWDQRLIACPGPPGGSCSAVGQRDSVIHTRMTILAQLRFSKQAHADDHQNNSGDLDHRNRLFKRCLCRRETSTTCVSNVPASLTRPRPGTIITSGIVDPKCRDVCSSLLDTRAGCEFVHTCLRRFLRNLRNRRKPCIDVPDRCDCPSAVNHDQDSSAMSFSTGHRNRISSRGE